jgi:photosystem II stability/assembly factor-like uncharacterized protein
MPTISPHDPKKLLVACDMTGSYLSENAGASWHMFNLGGTTRFFEWDPNDAKVVYAGNIGLFRSGDGGRNWKLLFPTPSQVSGYEMADDHADATVLVGGKAADRVSSIAVQPGNSRKLYAAIGNTVRVSEDGGATWRVEREFATAVKHVWANRVSLFAAVERSVWVRQDGMWREGAAMPAAWIDISAGLPVFYAVAASGGVVSEDSGTTWRKFELPGSGAKLQAIATSAKHPDVAYVSYSQLKLDGQDWFGVARTADRGRTWTLVWKESRQAASNIHDAWITARFGPFWGENPLNLGVGPDDPNLAYGTDLGRTLRTTDGGKIWEAVYSDRSASGWTSNGMDVTTNYGVHFDPFDRKRMFITYTDIGAFRSEDGGASWVSSTEGVPRPWVNTTYWMVFDPAVRGRVWAVASGTHDLPRPKMWRRAGVANYKGGVVASDDGGKTWRKAGEGMPETAATHILLDAKSPKEKRTLYVAAFGRGVYKSVDGGAKWTLKNNGISGAEPFAWRMAQDDGGKLYVVVARRSEAGEIGDDRDGALYVSADGAEHWSRIALPTGVNGPNGLTIDAHDPKRLYLAAWQRRGVDKTGGVWLSPDGGQTWRNVLDQTQHVYDVTVDPRRPDMLYASGFESSAWRSTDRGEHWARIAGFDFKWGHRVIPDPADSRKVFITTFGGSVWHGPVE